MTLGTPSDKSAGIEGVAPKKILCIGGGGYIGSRLVPILLAAGHHAEVLDTFWFGDRGDAAWKTADDAWNLDLNTLSAFDCVIWLAGMSNDPMADFSPAMNFIENAAAPCYIAHLAKRAGVRRFINASSCSVYGFAPDHQSIERSQPQTMFPYGIGKLMAERGCHQLVDENFSVISLRKGTVSGYSPRMRFDLIVNTMFRDAVRAHAIHVAPGEIWRPIVAMTDAVRAYLLAVEVGAALSGVFNIVTENATVFDVAQRVQQRVKTQLGINAVLIERPVIENKRSYRASGLRAKDALDFVPTGSVESIVDELCARLDEWPDFADPMYYNIEIFKGLRLTRQSFGVSHISAPREPATTQN
jgi:nucleoside-diphosphate-sugar epimerase